MLATLSELSKARKKKLNSKEKRTNTTKEFVVEIDTTAARKKIGAAGKKARNIQIHLQSKRFSV